MILQEHIKKVVQVQDPRWNPNEISIDRICIPSYLI